MAQGYKLSKADARSSGNPGAEGWSEFFQAFELELDDEILFELWSSAEESATEFGYRTAKARGFQIEAALVFVDQGAHQYRDSLRATYDGDDLAVRAASAGAFVLLSNTAQHPAAAEFTSRLLIGAGDPRKDLLGIAIMSQYLYRLGQTVWGGL